MIDLHTAKEGNIVYRVYNQNSTTIERYRITGIRLDTGTVQLECIDEIGGAICLRSQLYSTVIEAKNVAIMRILGEIALFTDNLRYISELTFLEVKLEGSA